MDNFPNPIWRAGKDAKCDFFNKAWLEFTGRTMEQEMGDGWTEGVHPDDFDNCVREYLEAFNNRRHFKLEYRLKHYDGTYHWLLDFGSPFYSDEGEFLGYIGSCYDNDENKKYLEKIKQDNEELEKLNIALSNKEKQVSEIRHKLDQIKNEVEE